MEQSKHLRSCDVARRCDMSNNSRGAKQTFLKEQCQWEQGSEKLFRWNKASIVNEERDTGVTIQVGQSEHFLPHPISYLVSPQTHPHHCSALWGYISATNIFPSLSQYSYFPASVLSSFLSLLFSYLTLSFSPSEADQ